MPKTEAFDKDVAEYKAWFVRHRLVYYSERQALHALLPEEGVGVDIGAGTGHFTAALGVNLGVEPSPAMRAIARRRDIELVDGVAEALPFADAQFALALMVTTICFLDDVGVALGEAYRVLKPGGALLIGMIDRDSPIGRTYQQHRQESLFYQQAAFYSVDEVVSHLKKAGFSDFAFVQTIFQNLREIRVIEPVKEGYGEGSFVVVRGVRPGMRKHSG